MGKLTTLKIKHLSKPGRYSDGSGLYIEVTKNETKSWLFRFQLNGKRSTAGLGPYHSKSNTLAMARAKAVEYKALINKGINPIEHARGLIKIKIESEERENRDKITNSMTFEVCALEYIKNKSSEWSNKKHTQQWTNTLTSYSFPHIGSMPVKDIETEDVTSCLDPIWATKTETATRVRQRIESVLSYAIAKKYRTSPNPATWKGLLDQIYPKPESVKKNRHENAGTEKHHNALPYDDAPHFINELKKMEGVSARALHFTILTASRTGEARFAKWNEFDFKKKEWNIPKGRMKARVSHRVALSEAAIRLLKSLPKMNDYVFPGSKLGKPISDGAMSAVLKRMKKKSITVHGFRSTFRDYIGEETGHPFRLAEFALAHGLTDEAEKAYARGDMLKKRFIMMNDWADFLNSYEKNDDE